MSSGQLVDGVPPSILVDFHRVRIQSSYVYCNTRTTTMDNQHSQQTADTNDLLRICARQYCRPLLLYFRKSSTETVGLSTLIDDIVKQAHGGREQVSLQLRHSVLPCLTEIGYLDFDERSDTVRYYGHSELETLAVAIANR